MASNVSSTCVSLVPIGKSPMTASNAPFAASSARNASSATPDHARNTPPGTVPGTRAIRADRPAGVSSLHRSSSKSTEKKSRAARVVSSSGSTASTATPGIFARRNEAVAPHPSPDANARGARVGAGGRAGGARAASPDPVPGAVPPAPVFVLPPRSSANAAATVASRQVSSAIPGGSSGSRSPSTSPSDPIHGPRANTRVRSASSPSSNATSNTLRLGWKAPVAGSTRSGTWRRTRTGHRGSPVRGWTERGWTRVSVSTRSAAVQSPRVEARVGGTDCDMPEFSSTNMGRSASSS